MNVMTDTDRIEKQVVLRAPRSAVWRAISDAKAFGEWFGVDLDGAIAPGVTVRGRVTNKGYEHVPFAMTVETVEPERQLAWRWHPDAPIEPELDYSSEPTTLVTFTLDDVPEGTMLTVVESGFGAIHPSRRTASYRGNDEGWTGQMENIARYLATSS